MSYSQSILERTREWVENQGYPLEMKVAKIFRNNGFDIRQSQLYRDGSTEKAREIDLIALHPDHLGVCSMLFTIECKSSAKPWVLFSTEDGATGMSIYWTYSLMSQAAREALSDVTSLTSDDPAHSIQSLFRRLRWLHKKEVSYALRQAFTDTDSAYAALTTCIKASSHAVNTVTETGFPQLRFCFPLIVIDAPLFLCKLGDTLDPTLSEATSGEILFTNPDNSKDTTCIRVVTLQELPKYVEEAKRELRQLTKELRPAVKRIWADEFDGDIPSSLKD